MAYEQRGYRFDIVDTKTIKVSDTKFKKMVLNGEVSLHTRAAERFKRRFHAQPLRVIKSMA